MASKKLVKKTGASHEANLKQLFRIEGQIRGIAKMIEDRRYCIDILHQLKAVKSSLASIERKVIHQHINHCAHKAVHSKNVKATQEVLEEIEALLKTSL